MKRFSYIYPALIVLLLIGCGKREPAADSARPPGPAVAAAAGPTPLPAGRSLATTWTLAMRVGDVDSAAATLREKSEEAGGYIANEVATGTDGERDASLDLRIPADKISAFRVSLRGLGTVTNDSETTEDVTEARADLDARLLAARAEESRALELMQSRTGTMSDVLETEKELARLRENVERLDAEKRAILARVDFAKVHVSLTPDVPAAWSTPRDSVTRAWKAGVGAATAAAVVGAMVAAATAPFVLPIAFALLLVRYAVRRWRSSMPVA